MNIALTPPPALQRSRGAASVGLGPGGRLRRLALSGSARAIVLPAEEGPEVVYLNTSGGLTSGDRLDYALELAAGGRASATTQTAERAYRATGAPARVRVDMRLGSGAHLDWLPQETILFDASRLQRRTRIELAEGATCLAVESVVLGRAAMGETVRDLVFDDHRQIDRAGQPVVLEPLRLRSAALNAPAALHGARAFASLVLVAPGAEDAVAPARAALAEPGVTGAASGWDGRLMVRLMAPDGWPLRRQILRLLAVLRPSRLPRVWQE